HSDSVVGSLAHLSRSQLMGCLDVRSSLLPAMLLRLTNEALRPGFVSASVVDSLGRAMLVECAQRLFAQDSRPTAPRGRLTARHFAIIEEYVAGLSGESPSAAALAAACGFSASHFARLFRKHTQQSIGQYLKA